MDATARIESPPSEGFVEEFQRCWSALPDKAMFGMLLAGWILLFYWFGWTSALAGRTDSLFDWMWGKWDDPMNDASHGKLIPWVVLGLLWMRRRQLIAAAASVWWPALPGLAFALGLHVLGFAIQQPRLSMVAFFSGIWILTGLVWGWNSLKASFFPFFVFCFCVPMGGTFAQGLTLPLRLYSAGATEYIARHCLDISVVREGTLLYEDSTTHWQDNGGGLAVATDWTALLDPNKVRWHYDVAAGCSGIRSLIALLAIATIFAVLTLKPLWKRGVMIASAIPLAIICNVIRLTTIILAANAYKSQAAGNYVDSYFGYVTYGMAIIAVLLIGKLLRGKPSATPP